LRTALGVATLLLAASAHAADIEPLGQYETVDAGSAYYRCDPNKTGGSDDPSGKEVCTFGFIEGVGSTESRTWEISTDIAFGNLRIGTSRTEVARALQFGDKAICLVARAGLAFDGNTLNGVYDFQGPILSVGVKNISTHGRFVFETGFRLLPPWPTFHGNDPREQQLAQGATLTSGAGDDARWLPLASVGSQLYVNVLARTPMCGDCEATWTIGAWYGGQLSLAAIQVRTWLSAQPQFIGNIYLEPFVAFSRFLKADVRFALGARATASVSSIWPSTTLLPLSIDGFVSWSPPNVDWLSARIFVGGAGSPTVGFDLQYGARVQFYLR